MDALNPPLLWGAWRCTPNERLFIAECQHCGDVLWIHRNGEDDWRASCADGCTHDQILEGAERARLEQLQRSQDEREARAAMDADDPFYGIEAVTYIELLTGEDAVRGFFRCPFHGGGEERTPSLRAHGGLWYCHACHIGGSIYDFGAHLWDLEPRREGFIEIQQRLARELGATWAT